MYGATVGRTALLDIDATTNQAICHVRPDAKRADTRYVWYALRQKLPELLARRVGGAQPNISQETIRSTRVYLPALPVQRRIADILDKADAIRRKRKQAIALTEELLRSTFLEMFGDPVTNPKGWPLETIDDLCSRGANLADGPFGSTLKPEHYVSIGVKVVRNWNIYDDRFDASEFKYVTEEKFREIRRSEVLSGDILITTKGTVGDICIAPDLGGPAVLSASGSVRLRLPSDESYLPEFLVSQMTSPKYKQYLHTFEAGSAQQYLNLSAIRKMVLVRPPPGIQRQFASLRSRVRLSRDQLVAAAVDAEHLSSALTRLVFSDRLGEAVGC
jgi:type I restriction enzyme S subunit